MQNAKIQEYIEGLLLKLGFTTEDLSVMYDEKTNIVWFSLSAQNSRFLLGRDAEALGALNHIAMKIVEKITREDDTHPRVVIDAGDHERKKIENLKTVAHMMAERARYFKSSIDVDPMPAHERRIVHEFLSQMPDIKTESVGEGSKRHIVIRYTDSNI